MLGAVVGGELDFHELGALPLALVRDRVPDAVPLASFREPSGEPIDRCVLAAPIGWPEPVVGRLESASGAGWVGPAGERPYRVTSYPGNEELDPE